MRFSPVAAEKTINSIIKKLPNTFTAAHIASWRQFFSTYPTEVEDIPEDRLLPVRVDALPRCATRAALTSLSRHQVLAHITHCLCAVQPSTNVLCSMHAYVLCHIMCCAGDLRRVDFVRQQD